MAIYTELDLDDIQRLAARYGLGPVSGVEELKGGQANSSYVLSTAEGRFVLSVCDEKSFSEVEQLTGLLVHLEKNGFPTTRATALKEGGFVTDHQGKPVYMKAYLEGTVPKGLTPAMAHNLGRRMARLHGLEPPPEIPGRFAYGLESFGQVIESQADPDYCDWLADKKDYLEKAIAPDLPRRLIHGDIFDDNTIYDGQKLVAIIDFEEACHYFRAFDLGMCAIGACTTGGWLDLAKTKAMVEGYLEAGHLEDREKERLKAFVIYGAAATSMWRFKQYNIVIPGHPMADHYRAMNHLADQVQGLSEREFREAVFKQ